MISGDKPPGAPLLSQSYEIAGNDFIKAGHASTKIKDLLKEIEVSPSVIRRTAICSYEAEMNIVLYARRGVMFVEVYPDQLVLRVEDEGQGIPDINLAMQEGWSTATDAVRERGFGAGMGLPNIKKHSDNFRIESTDGQGTKLHIVFSLTSQDL